MTSDEKKKYASEYVRVNRKLEITWFPRVKKAIDSKVSSLIRKLKEDGIQAAIRYLHLDIQNARLTEVISQMYDSVGLVHAKRTEKMLRNEVGKKSVYVDFEVKRFGQAGAWIQFIQNYLRLFLIEKITFHVNDTTKAKLLAVLNDAIENGWGVDEIVKRLEALPFTAFQSARIVRTEINRASNVGVQAQGETFQYLLMKEWVAVEDDRTRGKDPEDHADHFHMNEQTVDFEEVFKDPRNGHELRHPGDPEAEAEDVINCRCVMITKPKRDKNGRLIRKIPLSQAA